MVRRLEFDDLLVSLAVEAGAQLVTGADIVRASENGAGAVLMSRDGRRFEAPFVIAADGVHSVIARRLGINPGWPASSIALDMMEETPAPRCGTSIPRPCGSRMVSSRMDTGPRTTVVRALREAIGTFFRSAITST
jgi:flavin-dependent dehydrogenase